jgi:hypothetical protein
MFIVCGYCLQQLSPQDGYFSNILSTILNIGKEYYCRTQEDKSSCTEDALPRPKIKHVMDSLKTS